jgi:hypothetical protein
MENVIFQNVGTCGMYCLVRYDVQGTIFNFHKISFISMN